MKTKKTLSRIERVSCVAFFLVVACSGGVQTTCGTVTDADGGVVYLPCGGSSSGGDTAQAGQGTIHFAGATSAGGSVATGGITGASGATTVSPTVVRTGGTPDYGDVNCSYWIVDETSEVADQIPGYGDYRIYNPTNSDVSDFWLAFAVSPAYPNGDSTYAYAYSYFRDGYLYFEKLSTTIYTYMSVDLSSPRSDSRFPGLGIIWAHFIVSTVPHVTILANSSMGFSLRSTLCPRVKVIPTPGDPEYIYPPVGTSVCTAVVGYMFGNNPVGYVGAGLSDCRVYGGGTL